MACHKVAKEDLAEHAAQPLTAVRHQGCFRHASLAEILICQTHDLLSVLKLRIFLREINVVCLQIFLKGMGNTSCTKYLPPKVVAISLLSILALLPVI